MKRRVGLACLTFFASLTFMALFDSQGSAAPGSTVPPGSTSVIGLDDSRYAPGSPIWKLLEKSDDPKPKIEAAGFRFIWGDIQWHAEGAFAMAGGVALQEAIGIPEVHRTFCRGETACLTTDFEKAVPDARFRVKRLNFGTPKSARKDAVEECRGVAQGYLETLAKELTTGRGLVIGLHSENAFPQAARRLENSKLHLFAVFGIEADGALLLRDSADTVPVTYRLPRDRVCDALTIPRAFNPAETREPYFSWVLAAWSVRPGPGAKSDPTPQPIITPGPGPGPGPTETSTGSATDDPFPLGFYQVPAAFPVRFNHRFQSGSRPPAGLKLGVGLSPDTGQRSQSVLTGIEGEWGVVGQMNRFAYRGRARGAQGDESPLEYAYRIAGRLESERLTSLLERFTAGASRLRKDQQWTLRSILNLVQSIPYELIRDDAMGLRAPVNVIYRNAGDCDSKSLLAAILLRMLGHETAVVVNPRAAHAVLGLAVPSGSGAYVDTGGKRYYLVECTVPAAIGDMGPYRISGNAAPSGWKAWPVTVR